MKAIFILEGKLNENDQYQLSKDVEQLAKDWRLTSYLDDVIEDDVQEVIKCEIPWEDRCSREELKDAVLQELLPEIRNVIIDFNLRDKIYDIISQWSKRCFEMMQKGVDEEIIGDIFKRLSINNSTSVKDEGVCEHNNTITNNCSDCDEQELKDYINTSVEK